MAFALLLSERYAWLAWSPERLGAELQQRIDAVRAEQRLEFQAAPLNTLALLDELDRLWAVEHWDRAASGALLSALARLADKLPEHEGLRPLAGLMLERLGADGPTLIEAIGTLAAQPDDAPTELARAVAEFFARRRGQLEDARERYAAWWYSAATLCKGAQRLCTWS